MALLNWIKPNTYLIVDEISYIKKQKYLTFTVILYADSTKTEELMKQQFIISDDNKFVFEIEDFSTTYPSVIVTNTIEPPEQIGKTYILTESNKLPVLLQLSSSYQTVYHDGAVYDGSNYDSLPKHYEWKWNELPIDDNVTYNHPTQGKLKYNSNTLLFETAITKADIWNTYFSVDAISEHNIIKQCYLWLKSQNLFEGLIDA